MTRIIKNKKGIYEYLLTKVVMLAFIMALVSVFQVMLSDAQQSSAREIVQAEATRISKQIDDAIGFKGVSNTITIHLKRGLQIGRDYVSYEFKITDEGIVVLDVLDYPYRGSSGIAKFGIGLSRIRGQPHISCTTNQVDSGVSLKIDKESSYRYDPHTEKLYLDVNVKIDASDYCHDFMEFEQSFCESGCD
jgi:hypothetical protein